MLYVFDFFIVISNNSMTQDSKKRDKSVLCTIQYYHTNYNGSARLIALSIYNNNYQVYFIYAVFKNNWKS